MEKIVDIIKAIKELDNELEAEGIWKRTRTVEFTKKDNDYIIELTISQKWKDIDNDDDDE